MRDKREQFFMRIKSLNGTRDLTFPFKTNVYKKKLEYRKGDFY